MIAGSIPWCSPWSQTSCGELFSPSWHTWASSVSPQWNGIISYMAEFLSLDPRRSLLCSTFPLFPRPPSAPLSSGIQKPTPFKCFSSKRKCVTAALTSSLTSNVALYYLRGEDLFFSLSCQPGFDLHHMVIREEQLAVYDSIPTSRKNLVIDIHSSPGFFFFLVPAHCKYVNLSSWSLYLRLSVLNASTAHTHTCTIVIFVLWQTKEQILAFLRADSNMVSVGLSLY